eukprot:2771241-Prymnesium_polylepis.1
MSSTQPLRVEVTGRCHSRAADSWPRTIQHLPRAWQRAVASASALTGGRTRPAVEAPARRSALTLLGDQPNRFRVARVSHVAVRKAAGSSTARLSSSASRARSKPTAPVMTAGQALWAEQESTRRSPAPAPCWPCARASSAVAFENDAPYGPMREASHKDGATFFSSSRRHRAPIAVASWTASLSDASFSSATPHSSSAIPLGMAPPLVIGSYAEGAMPRLTRPSPIPTFSGAAGPSSKAAEAANVAPTGSDPKGTDATSEQMTMAQRPSQLPEAAQSRHACKVVVVQLP